MSKTMFEMALPPVLTEVREAWGRGTDFCPSTYYI